MSGVWLRRASVVAVAALLGLPLVASQAVAGGYCRGTPVSDVRMTKVVMHENCFVPTIVRIRPGQSVTWINKDADPHVVAGANTAWGSYDNVSRGETVTLRFKRPGVYPYFCFLHIGMIGAVVVGDGGKPSASESLDAAVLPAISPSSSPEAASAVENTSTTGVPAASPGRWRVIALVALGLLIAAGVGLALQRDVLRRSQARARAG